MKNFLRENGWLLLIISFLLSLFITISSSLLGGSVNPIAAAVGTITAPIRGGVAALVGWSDNVKTYILHYDELEGELSALQIEVAELESELRGAEDAIRENEQLRVLLGLQAKRQDFTFEAARITSRASSSWESTLTLSKGSSDGVSLGDCVVTETGALVGIVSEVSYSFCVVSTVINGAFEMGGIISRTYSAGVLEGDFSLMTEDKLKLSYLSESTQLVAGDEVVTSGSSALYPSGLVVGQVESVFTDPSGMTRYAVVTPEVALADLVEVFIIKDFDIIE